MMIFQIICLCFSLFVLQVYVTKGVYTKRHRLLPVVLMLICVYQFYETVLLLVNNKETLLLLMDLLLIQFIYLLMQYVVDFTQIIIPVTLHRVLFLSLLVTDICIFLDYADFQHRRKWVMTMVLVYALLTGIFATRAYWKSPRTRREHQIDRMLYIAMLVAELGSLCWRESSVREQLILSGAFLISGGIVLYLIETNQMIDLTAIMQENLFDASKNGVILLDSRFYYLDANVEAKKIFQSELAEEEKNRNFGAHNLPKLHKMAEQGTGELVRGGSCYKYQITPLWYQKLQLGYILSLWEITEEKQQTRAMEEKKVFAEEQTRLKSRFLAAMSHDLRSPVHAIIGSCDILIGKRELSARNRALVQHIKSAGRALLDNVNDILLYSKLEAGKLELTEEEYSTEELLGELAEVCVANLQSKPVNLVVHIPERHPCQLLGDRKRIYGMLQNLFSNAVKYTRQGEIRCEMRISEPDSFGQVLVECEVSDTGKGMSREQLRSVFEDYVTYSSPSEEGTGLGLSIVRQLSGLMGGSVRAESDGIHGSMVTVTYCQKIAEQTWKPEFLLTKDMILQQSILWKEGVMPSYVYPEAKVLLADDMQINRQIFGELVAPWEFTVDYVKDGREAVEAVRNREYQLVFLDRMMPGMSGNEAARQIRQFSSVPLVVVTADLSQDNEEWRDYGFDDFLPKPIEREALKRILEYRLPAKYRRKPENTVQDTLQRRQQGMARSRRTLETFVEEAEDLKAKFEEYAEQDRALLQTKVHGIKGACRQVGQISMGEAAEVMEMAAKTDNMSFVQRHMEDFLFELNQTIEEVRKQIELLPKEVADESDLTIPEKADLWRLLKEAFVSYQMSEIERILEQLKRTDLTHEEREILLQAENYGKEFEYEEGCSLLEEFLSEKEPE